MINVLCCYYVHISLHQHIISRARVIIHSIQYAMYSAFIYMHLNCIGRVISKLKILFFFAINFSCFSFVCAFLWIFVHRNSVCFQLKWLHVMYTIIWSKWYKIILFMLKCSSVWRCLIFLSFEVFEENELHFMIFLISVHQFHTLNESVCIDAQ